jgi:protein-tyrosine phosphatase
MSDDAGERSGFSDFAELAPGLFVGAHPEPEDPFELGATVVVCLASGTSVRSVPRDGVLVHWPIPDGPVPDSDTLRGVASLVAACLRSEAVVYVHCQAGMNRSALVAARVLMEQGMSAQAAIETVREQRKGSLSDEYAAWLRAEEEAPPAAEARSP